MDWRFYGLVAFIFLLFPPFVRADTFVPNSLAPNAGIGTEAATANLLLPAPYFFDGAEPLPRGSQQEGDNWNALHATWTTNAFAYHAAPPLLALPAPVHDLVGPWLLRLTNRDLPVMADIEATGPMEQSPRSAEKKAPLPRVDQVWRVAPAGALARTSDGLTIDRGFELGLEVHAGSTKKDRATNAIKSTASTQVTLLPESYLQPWIGQYLGTLGKDKESGQTRHEQMRLVLTTNGEYNINPSTRAIHPKEEVVGTLSWRTTPSDHFTRDPWQVVAFRWHPTVSCEGRHLLGEVKNNAEGNRVSLATLTGNLHGDLRLDFLSPWLAASGNYQYGQRLTDARTQWEQATFSWQYQLNPHVSLGGSFTHSTGAPTQQTERGVTLEIGVTF